MLACRTGVSNSNEINKGEAGIFLKTSTISSSISRFLSSYENRQTISFHNFIY